MCEEVKAVKKSLGIYVHIPFCVRKCRYCDFLSQVGTKEDVKLYVKQLLEEIHAIAPLCKEYRIDSIFIGGGTPSVLEPVWIEQILKTIYEQFQIEAGNRKNAENAENAVEITIECNPGTLSEEKVRVYKKAGVNRISLGLQSANDKELKLLGRIHTWEQFLESVSLVKRYFQNWNVDIMSALPGQSLDSYRDSLEKVLALEPTHISAYSLIIEEGTPFYEIYREDDRLRQMGMKPEHLPDEETERAMYELTETMLKQWGYHRYEISNYAKGNHESRHNNRYWLREDYLGVGLGAASCMDNVRFSNTADMDCYMSRLWSAKNEETPKQSIGESDNCRRNPVQFWRDCGKEDVLQLTIKEQMEETMYLGLRTMQGVDSELFYKRFGKRLEEVFGHVLSKPENSQLLKHSGKYIQLTQYGIDVSNYVLAQFLLEE